MTNRLKSLELQGYKTFATKTLFEFPANVTAIVGPNGAGKSNIADAVRWVLGEQAYSLLRGKKTVDMIFFGSEDRSRASMASVSITLDNEDGWLPIDFSEVVITRRAYRSGENEYLINNQRVRLKEINELLANSGLGERTYTIIGQGLVDSSLSLRPDERRAFFEEAAGIGLYRSRREESVQKLNATLRNMERVTDILGELEPRLETLQKSMEKAANYEHLRADLEMLLREWYGYQWNQQSDALRRTEEVYRSQREILDEKRVEKEAVENDVDELQKSLGAKRAKLAEFHRELAGKHTRIEEINREIAVLDERSKSAQNRVDELTSSISLLQNELEKNQLKHEVLHNKGQEFLIELKDADTLLNIAKSGLEEKERDRRTLEQSAMEIRKEILKIESRLLELNSAQDSFAGELQMKILSVESMENRIRSFRVDVENLETSIRQEKLTREEIKDTLEENKEKKKILQEEKDAISSGINTTEAKIKVLETQLSKAKAELEVLQEEEKNLAGISSGSASIIKAAREKRIPGKYSLIIDQVNVPEKYETAVAAALGDILDGVLIESGTDPFTVLDFINRKDASRTVLIPENWTNTSSDSKREITHIYAPEIIAENGKYARQLKSLLRDTIILEDSRTAVDMVGELDPGWRIVTLDGLVFDSRGTITAGFEFKTSQLRRKRNKQSLLQEINSKENILADAVINFEEWTSRREKNSLAIQELVLDAEEKEEKIHDLDLSIYKKEIELSQKNQNLENVIQNRKDAETAIEELRNRLRVEKEIIIELSEKKNVQENIVSGISEKLGGDSLEELRSDVMRLTSRKAVAEAVQNQHAQQVQAAANEITSIENRILAETGKLDVARNEMVNTDVRKGELKEENREIKNEIDRLSREVHPLEEEVESVIGKQGNILEKVDKKRQAFSVAERHMMQAQLRRDKVRDSLESLRERIRDDFGLIRAGSEAEYTISEPLPFDELVASLPELDELPQDLEDQISQKRSLIKRLVPINPDAERDYLEVNERFQFLSSQLRDLQKAEKDLRQVVLELDTLMEKEFLDTFYKVEKEFREIFEQLFNGGAANLIIEDPENILESGIDIEATLPGKRKQELALLSGGERSLAAVALIFALLRISPTPFCVLDEVDAMLDESNVARFGDLLRDLSELTQFIVITHNRNTVQLADVLYGVTMSKDSVSQVVSLRMDELTEEMVN